jgi:hypothetical protein
MCKRRNSKRKQRKPKNLRESYENLARLRPGTRALAILPISGTAYDLGVRVRVRFGIETHYHNTQSCAWAADRIRGRSAWALAEYPHPIGCNLLYLATKASNGSPSQPPHSSNSHNNISLGFRRSGRGAGMTSERGGRK